MQSKPNATSIMPANELQIFINYKSIMEKEKETKETKEIKETKETKETKDSKKSSAAAQATAAAAAAQATPTPPPPPAPSPLINIDYKRITAPLNTVTRDMMKLSADTRNVYETTMIIAKRSNQVAREMKDELEKKLQEFASYSDNLEEVFENREQIEISRFYEKLPKSTLIAAQEYEEGKVYYKNPSKEKGNF